MRLDTMVRQAPTMMHRNGMQFVAAMEDLRAVVAMRIKTPAPDAVVSDHPDISVPAENDDIGVRHIDNVLIVGAGHISLFIDRGRYDQDRRRCYRHTNVWVHCELALSMCHASC